MREQVLEEAAEVRLTEQEASLIVALHAEREQKDNATTLRDLAESLRISLAEAQNLLNEVRASSKPSGQVTVPAELGAHKKGRRKFPWGASLALLAFALLAVPFLAMVADEMRFQESGVSRVPARVVRLVGSPTEAGTDLADLGKPPFYAQQTVKTAAAVPSEFEVAVKESDSAVYMPSSPRTGRSELTGRQADVLSQLTTNIFACLELASRDAVSGGGSVDFVTIAVGRRDASWVTFDVPCTADGGIHGLLHTFEGRNSLRNSVNKALLRHWPEFASGPRGK
jgi:hypothetical protein